MNIVGSNKEHTKDKYGNYRHPFSNLASEVQTIYYDNGEKKSFSTKLNLVKRSKSEQNTKKHLMMGH